MTEKLNPIERALVAAAGMGPPDARSVLMLICQAGMTTTEKVEQPPSPGAVHYARREKIIKRTKSACDRVIDYAKHETLRKVEKHFRDTGVAAAGGDDKPLSERLAFNKYRFKDEMESILKEEATVALATAGQQLFDEVGADDVWKTPAADALKYLDARENLFANASDEIHGEVMQQIQNGLDHGETKKELMARIGATFDGIKQTRADTIANTETAAAFNFSRDKAMREAGVTHKKWLHSQRPEQEPRLTHVENDGQTVPLDDPFDIGGVQFMYPSDDSLGAGPEDIINCHCVAIPVEVPATVTIKSGDFVGHPFHGNQYEKHAAQMSLDEVKQMAEEFQTLRKERNKLGSWPAYEIRMKELHGEEYTSDIRTRFATLRDKIIHDFGIEGTKYDKYAAGEKYLDSHQVAERSFAPDTAVAFHKRAKILHEKVKKGD